MHGWLVSAPVRRGRWLAPARVARARGGTAAPDTGPLARSRDQDTRARDRAPSDRDRPRTAVLVHGIGVSRRYFTPLHEELAIDHRVVVPDLPGYGHSRHLDPPGSPGGHADAVLGLLDQLDVAQAVLVGHSMGTQVVTEMLVRRPAVATGAVLLGPISRSGIGSVPRLAARLLRCALHERPQITAVAVTDYLRCGLRRYRIDLPGMLDYPLAERLAETQVPVAVGRGAEDPVTRATALHVIAERAGVPPVDLARAGHAVMDRAVMRVAELCRAFS